jgi:hypothetical protein
VIDDDDARIASLAVMDADDFNRLRLFFSKMTPLKFCGHMSKFDSKNCVHAPATGHHQSLVSPASSCPQGLAFFWPPPTREKEKDSGFLSQLSRHTHPSKRLNQLLCIRGA